MRCLWGNDWVIEKERGKGRLGSYRPRKTGDITWYGDYIDDKARHREVWPPEKEVDENDSGELSGNHQCSGAPDNSSRSHFSATTWPRWLRWVRNRHRHAIERTSRKV